MLQLPSEGFWLGQLLQRHSAATLRQESLAASQVEAGHQHLRAMMSAAMKYAPQAASATVGLNVNPSPAARSGQRRWRGRWPCWTAGIFT